MLAVSFPAVLKDLQEFSHDCVFEYFQSPKIKTVKLFYENNKVTRSEAVIFVHTKCQNKYTNFKDKDGIQTAIPIFDIELEQLDPFLGH